VDTRILLSQSAPVGTFAKVLVTGTQTYDLRGDPMGMPSLQTGDGSSRAAKEGPASAVPLS